MLHEIEHVAQYAAKGGFAAFVSEYVLSAPAEVIAGRTFQVHGYMPLEAAANDRANVLDAAYGWTLLVDNACASPVVIQSVLYDADSDDWKLRQFPVEPNAEVFLGDERNMPLHTQADHGYIRAWNMDTGEELGDPTHSIDMPGGPQFFFQVTVKPNYDETYALDFTC